MSIAVGVGLSSEKDPNLAAKEAVKLARIHLHSDKIDLAIVFGTIELCSLGLLKTLSFSLGENVPIVGCSGAAIISNQGIFKHGLIVMLLSFPQGIHLNTACIKGLAAKTPLIAGEDLGQSLLYGFKDVPRDFGIVFSDGLIHDNSDLIHGLQERLGTSFPLIGASASDNLMFQKTFLFFNKELFGDGACGILFGGKLNFGLGIKHGWKPLGKQRCVTKSVGNVVYEIDNTPAVKVYEEYFGAETIKLKKELKNISILYPIGLSIPGEEEYLLRNLLSIENDGSLVFQGNVPENSLIRLMIGTKDSCLAATKAAASEARERLFSRIIDNKKKGLKNFVLVFDSVSRYILLKREAIRELEIIKDVLGNDTPIIGLYTYGEQAPLRAMTYHGKAYSHNQTIAILTIAAKG